MRRLDRKNGKVKRQNRELKKQVASLRDKLNELRTLQNLQNSINETDKMYICTLEQQVKHCERN